MKFSRELGVPAIPPAGDEANTSQLCPQNKGQGQTRVANSSGPSWNKKRSTANTHKG